MRKVFILLLLFDVFAPKQSFGQQPQTQAKRLNEMAEKWIQVNPDSSFQYASKALQIASKEKDWDEQFNAYIHLSTIYSHTQRHLLSIQHVEAAEKISGKFSDKIIAEIRVHRRYATIYESSGEKKKALKHIFNALALLPDDEYQMQKLHLLNLAGYVYYSEEFYGKALHYYKLSLSIAQKLHANGEIAMTTNNIAAVYETEEKYSLAKQYFKKASFYNQSEKNYTWLGINYMNLGVISTKQDSLHQALKWLLKADSIFAITKDQAQIVVSEKKLGETYLELGDVDKAWRYSKLSEKICIAYNFTSDHLDVCKTLSSIYEKRNIPDSANLYYKKYILLMEDIRTQERSNNLLEYEANYNLFKYKSEQKTLKTKRKFKTQIWIISLLTGCSILFALFYIQRLRLKRIKEKKLEIENELKYRNNELISKVLLLTSKQATFSEFLSKLEILRNKDEDLIKDELEKIMQQMRKETLKKTLNEFELYFNNVHNEFFDQLFQSYPTLTRSDKRLCAFIYINLSSKEIASITGQRVESIEVGRGRLRKKLNLNNSGMSFGEFFENVKLNLKNKKTTK